MARGHRGEKAYVDRSSRIGTAGRTQVVAPENDKRKSFFIINLSTETLWLDFGVFAVTDSPSIPLLPGSAFSMEYPGYVDTSDIFIVGQVVGSKYVAREA